jgi:hypothetical protein
VITAIVSSFLPYEGKPMSLSNLEVTDLQRRKAARSVHNGACVEVAPVNGKIFVRDSKDRNGTLLWYPGRSWHTFVVRAKAGRFDPDRL